MNEKDNKKSIHLIWFYIILIVLTVFFSALFSLLKLQTVDYHLFLQSIHCLLEQVLDILFLKE